jgi:hypothetical protein
MNLVLWGQGMMKITNHSSINALMEAHEPILRWLGMKQIMIHKVISISGHTKYQNLNTKPWRFGRQLLWLHEKWIKAGFSKHKISEEQYTFVRKCQIVYHWSQHSHKTTEGGISIHLEYTNILLYELRNTMMTMTITKMMMMMIMTIKVIIINVYITTVISNIKLCDRLLSTVS